MNAGQETVNVHNYCESQPPTITGAGPRSLAVLMPKLAKCTKQINLNLPFFFKSQLALGFRRF